MTETVVGVRLTREDAEFLDAMAAKNMSYRGTIARHLLHAKIAELRASEFAESEGEGNNNGQGNSFSDD